MPGKIVDPVARHSRFNVSTKVEMMLWPKMHDGVSSAMSAQRFAHRVLGRRDELAKRVGLGQ
jgi:hypothetical protein